MIVQKFFEQLEHCLVYLDRSLDSICSFPNWLVLEVEGSCQLTVGRVFLDHLNLESVY